MSKFYDALDETLIEFIREQRIFFVASAPNQGHINLSPKGMDTFFVQDEQHVAFMNFTGSGNESAAHLLENGRMTIMFCSFGKVPLILRLYGRGQVVHSNSSDWSQWLERFGGDQPGQRQVITLQVTKVQTSCGFAVPYFHYEGERNALRDWGKKKGHAGVRAYALENNIVSMDGLSTGLSEQVFPERIDL